MKLALSSAGLLLLSTGAVPFIDGEIAAMFSRDRKGKCESASQVLAVIGEQNVNGAWQGKSAPYLQNGGWAVEADFIYWRADEDGLEYVQSSKFHKPNIAWDPGFKVGLGYTFGTQDFWDLFFRWTYFRTHQDDKISGASLAPWWQPSQTGATATSAAVDWNLHYDTYDLELGRHYFVSKTMALRPSFGLRGATIHQNYKARYQGVFPSGDVIPTSFKTHSNFWGVGIRGGSDIEWRFTKNWAVTGSIFGALLYGHFNIHEKLNGVATGTTLTSSTSRVELSRVAPNIEASLGFEWDTFFSDEQYHLGIGVMYEFSEWFSQNQVIRSEVFSNNANGQDNIIHSEHFPGDLGLQGLTVKVRFDF